MTIALSAVEHSDRRAVGTTPSYDAKRGARSGRSGPRLLAADSPPESSNRCGIRAAEEMSYTPTNTLQEDQSPTQRWRGAKLRSPYVAAASSGEECLAYALDDRTLCGCRAG